MSTFKDKIKEASKSLRSNVVLALDLMDHDPANLYEKCARTLESVTPYICALKLNRPLVLRLCLQERIKNLVKLAHDHGLATIMDAKLNDVAHTNLAIALQYFDAGFDAIIASPFVGWEGGLDSLFLEASHRDKGVILLVHMSHKGATEGYGQTVIDPVTGEGRSQFMIFAEKAVAWGADGAVVGATHTEQIAAARKALHGKVPIYSPGVIAQGGSPVEAVKAGADYLIVGRAIYDSPDPVASARSIRDQVSPALTI